MEGGSGSIISFGDGCPSPHQDCHSLCAGTIGWPLWAPSTKVERLWADGPFWGGHVGNSAMVSPRWHLPARHCPHMLSWSDAIVGTQGLGRGQVLLLAVTLSLLQPGDAWGAGCGDVRMGTNRCLGWRHGW